MGRNDRRRFLKALPAAVAAGIAAPALAQQGQQQRIDLETLDCAGKIFGIDFGKAEDEAALRGVNSNLGTYEQLRALDIPLDTEPAITFRPYLPGKAPKPGATPGAKLKLSTAPPAARRGSIEDLAFLPVTTLAGLIARREVSSTDLTKMYLARLEKHGPRLNSVVTLTKDLALEQAAAADREIKAGRYRGPLHGIPWGAKDLFATKGIPTTFGAAPFQKQVIDYDATIVERLRDAGAVLVAKLSMGALAQGDQWFGGRTRNPWNPERGSSGSSAGPGSATAAGLVGFSIGTETRGSIISPSAENGVVGLRPTYGRISRHGAMALSWTMDKIGPMCRTVEDCVVVFNAIYGPDGRDSTVVDAAFTWTPDVALSKLKIGYIPREFEPPAPAAAAGEGRGDAAGRGESGGRGRGAATPEERRRLEERSKVLNEALEVYRKAGAKLEAIELPGTRIANMIGFILNTESAAAFDDLTRSPEIADPSLNTWPNTFRTHRFVPAVEYIRAQRARTLLMRQMDELMSKYDVLLTPTNSQSLGLTNLTGHPAVAMKAGFVNNTPVEIMVTGRLYDEATMLRVALAYERVTKWHTMHPTL
ncbi:MAG: amidase [Acidobacteriota bacterium]|nr:amidase [Acidobacteriota bacterium]MDQ3418482.1 amidase [Acidobacteriota bacterium]